MKRTKRVKLTLEETVSHFMLVVLPAVPFVLSTYPVSQIAFGTYDGKGPDEIVIVFLVSLSLTLYAFFYKYRQLEFKTISVDHHVDHFQDAVRRTASQRHWSIAIDKPNFIRAYRSEPGLISGEMITLLREDDMLYLNSVANPKLRSTFSTGSQDKINLRLFLINLQESILGTPPNDHYQKQEEAKAHSGRFVRTLATIFAILMILGGTFIIFIDLYKPQLYVPLLTIGIGYLRYEWALKKEQERLDAQNEKR